jgi:endo-1,4-beta-xylanase
MLMKMKRLYGYGVLLLLLAASPLAAQSLRNMGDQRNIRIGAAVDPSHFGETAYADTLAREFSQVEPENAMKFGPIHPGVNTYSFTQPDAIVKFAQDHNMVVRGHTLVWHQQVPAWVTNGNYTPDQLSQVLQDHIGTVVRRYAGQVYAWDVVNEAFNDDGTMRSTIWSNAPGIGLPGPAYIEQALRWAHEADPGAILFYNDYNGEGLGAKSDAIYKMAQDFRARGVPLGGIGLQMHFTTNPGSLANIEANIRRLTALGLQVQITELDVRLQLDSSGNASAQDLGTQAQIYQDITTRCLKFPLCTAIQTWGFTDKYSWIPGTFPNFGAGLEFDTAYRPKASHDSMVAAMQAAPPVIEPAGLVNAASYTGGSVAPGEIVVLFGPTFGPAALAVAQADDTGALATKLADTRVLFDGVAAPLLYARAGQVSAVVPFGVSGKSTTQVQYEYQGLLSNAVSMDVRPAVPGLFNVILDLSGHLNSTANPAHRGDVLILYATGAGAMTPTPVDGQIALNAPFPVVAAKVSVTIGGVDCPVQYAGGAYGLVAGALQLNVQVAPGVPTGPQTMLMTVGGVTSADIPVVVE